eukprot:256977-Chlamydomonas_euryale.AAC.1
MLAGCPAARDGAGRGGRTGERPGGGDVRTEPFLGWREWQRGMSGGEGDCMTSSKKRRATGGRRKSG